MFNERISGPVLAPTTERNYLGGWRASLNAGLLWFFAVTLVAALAATRAQADPSLVASWPMNEGSGNVVNDAINLGIIEFACQLAQRGVAVVADVVHDAANRAPQPFVGLQRRSLQACDALAGRH